MKSLRTGRKNTYGFSMVELMVALALGLIIMAGVSAVFVNSTKSYHTTDATARLQENARFALHFLTTDVRRIGHIGCANNPDATYSTLNGGSLGGDINPQTGASFLGLPKITPVEGVDGLPGPWEPSSNPTTGATAPGMNINGAIAGTDAFFLRYLDIDNGIPMTLNMNSNADPVAVSHTDRVTHKLEQNQIIAISDCTATHIFQITKIEANAGNDLLYHEVTPATSTTVGNALDHFNKIYEYDTQALSDTTRSVFGNAISLVKFSGFAYFIGTGASGQRALFRTDPTAAGPQEMVEGIEDMQVTYGVATIADRVPSTYLRADQFTSADQWRNVISLRIGLLVSTVADTVTGEYGNVHDEDTGTYDVNGTTITAPKNSLNQNARRMRKVFVATYMLRNVKDQQL
jgi:type IV pilus assembly protein PilW